jgi:hypothetical protein
MVAALEALEKIHDHPKSFWNFREEITALRAALAETAEPIVSTEHGPWVDSPLYDGEKYCKRCNIRSIFADKRKCDPHTAPQPPAPAVELCEFPYDALWEPIRALGYTTRGQTDEVVDAIRPVIETYARAAIAAHEQKRSKT